MNVGINTPGHSKEIYKGDSKVNNKKKLNCILINI